jgi:hypothetical protein
MVMILSGVVSKTGGAAGEFLDPVRGPHVLEIALAITFKLRNG